MASESQKKLQKEESVAQLWVGNIIDVMVYIAMLQTVTDSKERKVLLSCCHQLSSRICVKTEDVLQLSAYF